ncbi:MAG: Npun_F0494 family protein [Cyanobacteria bacterium J06638_7]
MPQVHDPGPSLRPPAPGHPGEADSLSGLPLHERRPRLRAARSLRCLPFRRAFYDLVAQRGLSSGALAADQQGRQLCFLPMGAERIEAHFRWLIRLGVLRREVDGQGLTERVRLTPMGRRLLEEVSGEIPRAGLRQRLLETLRRHRPQL